MEMIKSLKDINMRDMNEIDLDHQSPYYMSQLQDHKHHSLYYINQSIIEGNSYSLLHDPGWNKNKYQHLQG